ncbi:MAG TPA: glycosyltransferase family 1 protein, partial [Planctomycetaceae bacterium]|nr:glycosyltransferase family 1 protein [Planctomycetaceae bacterium]
MDVLHVINGEHYAGAERVQDLLAARLPQFGFRVTFACLKPGRFAQLRQCPTAPICPLPMHGRFDLHVAGRLAAQLRQGGYALVHTHTPRSALVGTLAARKARVPVVAHVHSPAWRDTTSGWRNHINALVER